MNYVLPLASRTGHQRDGIFPLCIEAVFKPSHFSSPDVTFGGITYRHTVRLLSKVLGIRMETTGGEDHPRVRVSVYAAGRFALVFLEQLEL